MCFSLAIFTEYSNQIGSGHLIESYNLARFALIKGVKVLIWIRDTAPASILAKFPYPYNFFHFFSSQKEIDKIQKTIISNGCKVILFNFRKVSNEALSLFKYKNFKLICIDELGNRHLDCDVVINPLIAEKYHNYSSTNDDLKFYTGPDYLPLSAGFSQAHIKKRVFNKEIKTVSVSLGGVDRTGTTLKLIDALAQWKQEVIKNIVLGAGFLYLADIYKRIELLKDRNFRIYHNIANIESLFLESDIAFTAGGDTLYELACLGTPAIVLYEDEHEKENGLAFERLGFGVCLGRGVQANKKDIFSALKRFEDVKIRRMHSFRGKEIVDGKGSHRILKIIERSIKNDRAVKASF